MVPDGKRISWRLSDCSVKSFDFQAPPLAVAEPMKLMEYSIDEDDGMMERQD